MATTNIVITTRLYGGTYLAAARDFRTSRVLHTASCTESDLAAARRVVARHYGEAAAATITKVNEEDFAQYYKHRPQAGSHVYCVFIARVK